MRIKGMDGSDFLYKVKKEYPQIVRIILSGQLDKEAALKSVKSAHQYLSKPCDPKIDYNYLDKIGLTGRVAKWLEVITRINYEGKSDG